MVVFPCYLTKHSHFVSLVCKSWYVCFDCCSVWSTCRKHHTCRVFPLCESSYVSSIQTDASNTLCIVRMHIFCWCVQIVFVFGAWSWLPRLAVAWSMLWSCVRAQTTVGVARGHLTCLVLPTWNTKTHKSSVNFHQHPVFAEQKK